MLWPTICIDDFFNDPFYVKNFADTLDFKKDPEGKWPGERTELLHNINSDFFNYTTVKIMSVLFPMNYKKLNWKATQMFQRTDGNIYNNNGWVHTDFDEFTSIIFLSNHKKCGTSLFKKKKITSKVINNEFKHECYKNTEKIKSGEEKYLKENNDQFEKTLTLNSRFNRLILFDSSNLHAAEKYGEENLNEDRLTLITFFTAIIGNENKYPISEMKRLG
jgi:hypothetical protein